MDERSKKLLKAEIRFLENKYGMHILSFENKDERDEATTNIRLGKAMKASLFPAPVNRLPC